MKGTQNLDEAMKTPPMKCCRSQLMLDSDQRIEG
jgi:hypothetical protein